MVSKEFVKFALAIVGQEDMKLIVPIQCFFFVFLNFFFILLFFSCFFDIKNMIYEYLSINECQIMLMWVLFSIN